MRFSFIHSRSPAVFFLLVIPLLLNISLAQKWNASYAIDKIPPNDGASYEIMEAKEYLKRFALKKINPKELIVIHPDYAIYKDRVYYRNEVIKGADPDTFSFIGYASPSSLYHAYSRDAKHVYAETQILSDADPQSFQILANGLTRDHSHLFDELTKVVDADPDSYEIISLQHDNGNTYLSLYAKDNNHLFYQHQIIEEADRASFHILENDLFAQDNHHFYFQGKVTDEIKGDSLTFLDHRFFRDNEHLYFYTSDEVIPILEANPDNIVTLGRGYLKDNQHLFYVSFNRYSIIEKVDPNSLHFFDESNFFKDKNRVYLRLSAFHYGDRDESKLPKARHYDYRHLAIDDIDTESFKAVGHVYAQDKDYIYVDIDDGYALLPNIDRDSFEYIGLGFVRDKNHLYGSNYYNFEIIPDVNPNMVQLKESSLDKGFQRYIKSGDRCFGEYEEINCSEVE